MNEKIIINQLSDKGVSVARKNVTIVDGNEYEIGEIHRCAYSNDNQGLIDLKSDVPEPYLSAILSVWGVEY